MRTTVDIPDSLFREAKAQAALRGLALKELIEEGLHLALGHPAKPAASQRLAFPLLAAGTRKTLFLDDAKKAIEQAELEDDRHRAGLD